MTIVRRTHRLTIAVRIALVVALIAPAAHFQAQSCDLVAAVEHDEACKVTVANPDPCPTKEIRVEFSCRIEDCTISVLTTDPARAPLLDKVYFELSDGYALYVRGPQPRIRHLFPFPGTAGTLVWAKATPYWKDTGKGVFAKQEYFIDGDTPYFGWNTNFWGLTAEFGTTFGNASDWRYSWDYGDGTLGTNKSWESTCKTYDAPGRYQVTLRFQQIRNCPASGCLDYTVSQFGDVPNRAPEPSFTYSNVLKRLSVDATATRDEPGVEETWLGNTKPNCGARRTSSGLTYEWDWGDGSFGSGLTATHDYASSGMYKVALLVKDHNGSTNTITKSVSIPDDPPKPAFSYNCHGGSCDFDAGASTLPNATAYIWTFDQVVGTGTVPKGSLTSSVPKVSYTFGNGIFRATLQVQTSGALTAPVTREFRSSMKVAEGLVFVPMLPCRLIDTRESGTPVASGQTLSVQIWGGTGNHCTIPSGVSAIATNLATIATGIPAGRSWLHAFRPGWGEADRTVAQFFNGGWTNGIRSNNTIVEVSTDKILLVPIMPGGGSVHLIADATGYFVKSTHASASQGLRYATTPFCTWFNSLQTNTPLLNGVNQNVAVGTCGPPATATAASLHVSLQPSNNGHMKITPSNYTVESNFATANIWGTFTNHNGWLAKMGRIFDGTGKGDYRLQYVAVPGATAHYQLAVDGWFQSDGPLLYYPIDPCRAVDTTRPTQTGYKRAQPNVSQQYQIRGDCGVPKGAVAAVVNVTAFNPSANGDLALFPSDAGLYPGNPQQAAVYQNFYRGDDMTTGAIVPLSPQHELDFGLKVRLADTDVYVDVVGYFGPPGLTNSAESPEIQ